MTVCRIHRNGDKRQLVADDELGRHHGRAPQRGGAVRATPITYTGETTLTWTLAEFMPGEVWNGRIVVSQTGTLGNMYLAAASNEQSPVEITVAPPGGGGHRIYLPLVMRNK